MRAGVEEDLKRLVNEGTLDPIEHSDWAAPIVPVLKSDQKTLRTSDLQSILFPSWINTPYLGWKICLLCLIKEILSQN